MPSALARLLHAPEIPAGVDPAWASLLTAMTATDPAARPSAREVAMALDEIILSERARDTGDLSSLLPDGLGRMATVDRYQILDTPAGGAFDKITALAAQLFRRTNSQRQGGGPRPHLVHISPRG